MPRSQSPSLFTLDIYNLHSFLKCYAWREFIQRTGAPFVATLFAINSEFFNNSRPDLNRMNKLPVVRIRGAPACCAFPFIVVKKGHSSSDFLFGSPTKPTVNPVACELSPTWDILYVFLMLPRMRATVSSNPRSNATIETTNSRR